MIGMRRVHGKKNDQDQVDGMKKEDYSKGRKMHSEMSDL